MVGAVLVLPPSVPLDLTYVGVREQDGHDESRPYMRIQYL